MLTASTTQPTTTDYTASTGVTGLAKAIADTAKDVLSNVKVKVQGTEVQSDGKGGLKTVTVDMKDADGNVIKTLPVATASDLIIEAIAYAVAKEVVADIQAHLQLVGGNATFSSYNAAGTWKGTGGGVVGPVVVDSAAGVSGSEKLNIAEGKFQ